MLGETIAFKQLLERSLAQQHYLYLLLDVAKFDEFWEQWQARSNKAQTQWCYLYQKTRFDHLSQVSPLLIQVEEGEFADDVLQWLSALLSNDWGILFSSTLTLESVLSHWQSWLTCFLPNGSETLFRFYEPNIMALFLTDESFDDNDRQTLVGVCGEIFLATEIPHQYTRLYVNTEREDVCLPNAPWFYFEQEQLDAIDGLYYQERLSELAVELFKLAPSICMPLSKRQVKAGLHQGIELAKQQFPNAPSKAKEHFSLQRFLLGSRFYQHASFFLITQTLPLLNALIEFSNNSRYKQEVEERFHDSDWLEQAELEMEALS
ncbi:DUF4123 domain-containing protein [Motilimonas sp. E26]|uniref:DUF4123 domain-containing protein n=1 Tax=Motilimonas sp. E26 TaxID=2865674 RepID=UPI001E2BDBA3|nr:DUF4123 domain-containing protein [Motilimonas sp. E26]MCE0559154.1 DUF4123 domain-containing protein [Motilimonas sp. E26]